MTSLKRTCQIGMFVLGLAAVPATTHAQPVCIYNDQTGVVSVVQIGQTGIPASPLLLGGYEIYYTDGEWHQLPIVGNLNLNPESVTLGWTTHFDWYSGDWKCPAGDTVIKGGEGGVSMDVTYHGDDLTWCPVTSITTPAVFACPAGVFPFDPDAIVFSTGAAASSNAK